MLIRKVEKKKLSFYVFCIKGIVINNLFFFFPGIINIKKGYLENTKTIYLATGFVLSGWVFYRVKKEKSIRYGYVKIPKKYLKYIYSGLIIREKIKGTYRIK